MTSAVERARAVVAASRTVVTLCFKLRALPQPIRGFYVRAWLRAVRLGDAGAFAGSARPDQIGVLLDLAVGRSVVVELGTGKAWTAAALALDSARRTVITYDTQEWPTRATYLSLVPDAARSRIDLRLEPAEAGPREADPAAGLLFIDSSHETKETVDSFQAWAPSLTDDAVVVFHDYTNPDFPGVASGVAELGLEGQVDHGMFIWRRAHPASKGRS